MEKEEAQQSSSHCMKTDNLDDDEDDPIVQEFPIYLTKDFQEQLYTLHYPTLFNQSTAPFVFINSMFKPVNEVLKMDVEINLNSENVSIDDAEQMARDINKQCDESALLFENHIVDKQTLVSTKLASESEQRAVGVFIGNEYHITPLKGQLSLKPDISYSTKLSKFKLKKEEQVGEASNAQKVTVRFAPSTSQQNEAENELYTYKKLLKKYEEEPWTKCNYHTEHSELSKMHRAKLYDRTGYPAMESRTSDEDFLRSIRQLISQDTTTKTSTPTESISFTALMSLPLLEQCTLLLKDVKILSFERICTLLDVCEEPKISNLLKILQEIALLVNGNWVIKSEILYPEEMFSKINKVPAEFMCKARDYVLWSFTLNEFVGRSQAASVVNLPHEELEEIFLEISHVTFDKHWTLNVSVDDDFIAKYSSIVDSQAILWKERGTELECFFKERGSKEKKQRRKSKSFSEDVSKVGQVNGDITINEKRKPTLVARRRTIKAKPKILTNSNGSL